MAQEGKLVSGQLATTMSIWPVDKANLFRGMRSVQSVGENEILDGIAAISREEPRHQGKHRVGQHREVGDGRGDRLDVEENRLDGVVGLGVGAGVRPGIRNRDARNEEASVRL